MIAIVGRASICRDPRVSWRRDNLKSIDRRARCHVAVMIRASPGGCYRDAQPSSSPGRSRTCSR